MIYGREKGERWFGVHSGNKGIRLTIRFCDKGETVETESLLTYEGARILAEALLRACDKHQTNKMLR